MKFFVSLNGLAFLALCMLITTTAYAKWSGGGDFSTYYTDDVSLFSVTRRLSLEQDPTQPLVDEPDQGNDFVYEPHAYIKWLAENELGDFELALDAGVYVFQQHSDYMHGFFQIEASQALTEKTKLKLFYDFIPDQFIGNKEIISMDQDPAEPEEAKEKIDTHVWSLHLEHELTEQFLLRGLVRYGKRDNKRPFEYRNIDFFTVGTHLEWIISPDVEVLLGYHFERGFTDRSQSGNYNDDIGYINHYASAELIIKLMPKLDMKLIADYEHNDFTTPFVDDIRYDGTENVYQGEIELIYELTHHMSLVAGWQYGKRKFSYETFWVDNNNGWIGAEVHF